MSAARDNRRRRARARRRMRAWYATTGWMRVAERIITSSYGDAVMARYVFQRHPLAQRRVGPGLPWWLRKVFERDLGAE